MSDTPRIKATFGPAEYIVPDIVAVGEYRCPDCNWWTTLPTGTAPVLSVRFTCGCGHVIEIFPAAEPTP